MTRVIRFRRVPRRVRYLAAAAGAAALVSSPALVSAGPPSWAAAPKPTTTVTVTQTVTATVTATVTQTVTAPPQTVTVTETATPPVTTTTVPTTATSSTTTPPPTTTTSPPPAGCGPKPDATNTGASANLPASPVTTLRDGQTLENVTVADLTITGSNITVRNVKTGGLNVDHATNVNVDHVTSPDSSIIDATYVTFANSNIGGSVNDAVFVSPWSAETSHVTLTGNYFPRSDLTGRADVHYDATQVRGIDYVTITCNNYALGAWQDGYNVAIYIENSGRGNNHVTIDGNWVDGGNYAVMWYGPLGMAGSTAPVVASLKNNIVDTTHFYFDTCYMSGGFTQANLDALGQSGNTLDGVPGPVCKQSQLG